MSEFTLKTYQFRTKEGIDIEKFLEKSRRLDEHLLAAEGFVYRSLSKVTNGDWLDCIYWSSPLAAKRAESLMQLDDILDFLNDIDGEGLQSTESDILSQVYPEMAEA
ncbi:MAG: hypothetical protein ACI93R_001341 [Flavobacteriales bacterium]|jgi:hypothetical protein